jgi:hypothetical protein
MTLAGFVAAATPSDSPSASHLPQEEGFGLRRFASGSGIRCQESGISSFAATSAGKERKNPMNTQRNYQTRDFRRVPRRKNY